MTDSPKNNMNGKITKRTENIKYFFELILFNNKIHKTIGLKKLNNKNLELNIVSKCLFATPPHPLIKLMELSTLNLEESYDDIFLVPI